MNKILLGQGETQARCRARTKWPGRRHGSRVRTDTLTSSFTFCMSVKDNEKLFESGLPSGHQQNQLFGESNTSSMFLDYARTMTKLPVIVRSAIPLASRRGSQSVA